MTTQTPPLTDPPTLLAIARAARQTGDRDLMRSALQLLRDEHGITIRFAKPTPAPKEAPRAS